MSTKLSALSQEEQNELPYTELCALRMEAYADHISKMLIPPELAQWARKMEFIALNNGSYEMWCKKNETMPDSDEKSDWCKTVGIWANRVPWVTGLMIVRWGEEPSHWPIVFDYSFTKRADKWLLENKIPDAVNSANKRGI